jgi:hypothetical protein
MRINIKVYALGNAYHLFAAYLIRWGSSKKAVVVTS